MPKVPERRSGSFGGCATSPRLPHGQQSRLALRGKLPAIRAKARDGTSTAERHATTEQSIIPSAIGPQYGHLLSRRERRTRRSIRRSRRRLDGAGRRSRARRAGTIGLRVRRRCAAAPGGGESMLAWLRHARCVLLQARERGRSACGHPGAIALIIGAAGLADCVRLSLRRLLRHRGNRRRQQQHSTEPHTHRRGDDACSAL